MTFPPPADLTAVQRSYDAVADNYVAMVGDPGPWLRAVLDAFAEQVRDVGPVLDAGCGPGWISAYLHERGVEVSGVDLSPRMVELARERYPHLRFDVASVTELTPAPGSLGGVLGWWSWFNLPREWLPRVVTTMAAALRPAGQLIVGSHRGDGDIERSSGYGGVPVQWTTHLHQPEAVLALAGAAGLEPVAELHLPPEPPARHPQFVVAARRPVG